MTKRKNQIIAGVLVFAIIITACTTRTMTPSPNPPPIRSAVVSEPTGTLTGTTIASETPTPAIPTIEPRTLVVCVGPEPKSLFLYGNPSKTALSILEAVYDGPYDRRNFDLQPVIIESKPSFENGSAKFEAVQVSPGDLILDKDGNWVNLGEGVLYRPSGCQGDECVQAYSGSEPVLIDSLVVRFKLIPGVVWSDGAPVTAHDSVYSFGVAKSLYPNYRPELVVHTSAYQAIDDTTVEWRGVPGYQSSLYQSFFFSPLPSHLWGSLEPEDLLSAEISSRMPVGWGPYVVDTWVTGDHISLRKNNAYFRAVEGLPNFDNLVFRFMDNSDEAVSALLAGECDLADESAIGESQATALRTLQTEGKLVVSIQPGTAWEQAVFGIVHSDIQQPSFFGIKEVRQAVAMCIDRQKVVEDEFAGLSVAPDSYVLPTHPLYNPDVKRYEFNPAAANDLLTAAGWLDADSDPATARVSAGVPGFVNGTPFQFAYLTSGDGERQRVAQVVKDSLAQCGIEVDLVLQSWEELLAAGPDGPVFGRNFDMAQFGWYTSTEPPCSLYTSAEVPGPYPTAPKGWGGANASGFSSPEFDQACREAFSLFPGSAAYQEAHFKAQEIFAEELPSLPLYVHLKLVATRPDFCGLEMDPSSLSALWNLEAFEYGESCP